MIGKKINELKHWKFYHFTFHIPLYYDYEECLQWGLLSGDSLSYFNCFHSGKPVFLIGLHNGLFPLPDFW